MKSKILVFGADEFTGRKVVEGLAATDWAVPISASCRRSAPPRSQANSVLVNATRIASIQAAMEGVDGVVNCMTGGARVVIASARALFGAAARLTTRVPVVHLSSISVYGSAVGLLDESAPLLGDLGPYSAANVAAEAIAASYPEVVIFRPGCEFGPGSYHWSIRIAKCLLARRLGDLGAAGDGYCNLVDVDDVARAVVRALQTPAPGRRIYNLCNPDTPTWNEFLTRYAIALRATPVRRISRRRLGLETTLLAPVLKAAELLAGRCGLRMRDLPSPIPPSLARLMRQEIRLDARRVETDLRLRWTGLNDTLEATARSILGR